MSSRSSSTLYKAKKFYLGNFIKLGGVDQTERKRTHQERLGHGTRKKTKKSFSHHAPCRCLRRRQSLSDCDCAVPNLAMTPVTALCPFQRAQGPCSGTTASSRRTSYPTSPPSPCCGRGGTARTWAALAIRLVTFSTRNAAIDTPLSATLPNCNLEAPAFHLGTGRWVPTDCQFY